MLVALTLQPLPPPRFGIDFYTVMPAGRPASARCGSCSPVLARVCQSVVAPSTLRCSSKSLDSIFNQRSAAWRPAAAQPGGRRTTCSAVPLVSGGPTVDCDSDR